MARACATLHRDIYTTTLTIIATLRTADNIYDLASGMRTPTYRMNTLCEIVEKFTFITFEIDLNAFVIIYSPCG